MTKHVAGAFMVGNGRGPPDACYQIFSKEADISGNS